MRIFIYPWFIGAERSSDFCFGLNCGFIYFRNLSERRDFGVVDLVGWKQFYSDFWIYPKICVEKTLINPMILEPIKNVGVELIQHFQFSEIYRSSAESGLLCFKNLSNRSGARILTIFKRFCWERTSDFLYLQHHRSRAARARLEFSYF